MIPLYMNLRVCLSLPVGLANPMVLIDSTSILSYRWVLQTPRFSLMASCILSLPVGLANPMVLIDSKNILSYRWSF